MNSTLQIYSNLEITSNTANAGGGATLFHSEIFCQSTGTLTITKNKALIDGGGIFASNSYITVLFDRGSQQHSMVNFMGNTTSRWGGAILLVASSVHIKKRELTKKSQLNLQADNILYFTSNSADHGGAIHVADETNYGMCSTFNPSLSTTSDCFIQILFPDDTLSGKYDIVSINSTITEHLVQDQFFWRIIGQMYSQIRCRNFKRLLY